MLWFAFFGFKKAFYFIKKKEYKLILLNTLMFFASLYIAFYFLWGFNYKCQDLSAKLNLIKPQLDTSIIYNEILVVNEKLDSLRSLISKDTAALSINYCPQNLEEIIRKSEQDVLKKWAFKTENIIRIRPLFPKGTLLVWSTAGIYNPFSFEGHYDAGLYHVQSTYVIAHEMAHGYGLTNEADCNFVALETCLNTDNTYIKYCGLLTYWRYLMSDLRKNAPYSFYKAAYHRPLGVRSDIKELYKHLDKYPDILPSIRDVIYDSYLKSNGVAEGLNSYNRVVDMVFAYRNKMAGNSKIE